MILALEGPDRSGKTTLHGALRPLLPEATFLPTLYLHECLFPVMAHVEMRQVELWKYLYDPSRLYVCDRSFAVTCPVYSLLYGRPMLFDLGPWIPEVRAVYLSVSLGELRRRYEATGDEYFDSRKYEALLAAYKVVLPRFQSVELDGTLPTPVLASLTLAYLRSLGWM